MIKKALRTVDILIIGGGLTGAALMLALMNQGYDVLLLEAKPFKQAGEERSNYADESANFDARTLALSPASIKILSELQVWQLLQNEASPITTIHVSQQGRFGTTELHADEEEALGAVLELQPIGRALHQLLPPEKVLAPAELVALDPVNQVATIKQGDNEFMIQAALFVAADGGHSTARRSSTLTTKIKLYNQSALVANIGLQRSHRQCAYERFTTNGPLAMLPMTQKRSAMIWCMPPDEAKRLQAMDAILFLKQLQLAFGYRLGRFVKVGKRSLFPLQEIIMPQSVEWPLVFVGNAAHTLHPVAGQGFNLGLRDIATLAQCILQYGLNATMLTHYQTMRQADHTAIIQFTDGLVRTFGSQIPGMALGRSLGLLAMDNMKILQRLLARYARGYGGVVPDLACGIPLERETAL